MTKILLTGGAGYIGSHTCVELLQAGYEVIVADNLVNSSREALHRVEQITGKTLIFWQVDLCNETAVDALFANYPDIDSVIHFAGLKAVGESVRKPLEYYTNNLCSTLNLLASMRRHGVKKLVFSSSAVVYGNAPAPVQETNQTGTTTNPYGTTKWFIERILSDCCAADPDLNVVMLRYFNPIGAHPSGLIGEEPNGIPNNLVPYIAQVAVGKLDCLHIYGDDYSTPDGTGVRDYIHVVDLAKGHVAALDKLDQKCGLFICNLGSGHGYSVLEVLHAYEKAVGHTIPYIIKPRRLGDVAASWADTTRAREELGWEAQLSLEDMCVSSWNWQKQNPNGYQPIAGETNSSDMPTSREQLNNVYKGYNSDIRLQNIG